MNRIRSTTPLLVGLMVAACGGSTPPQGQAAGAPVAVPPVQLTEQSSGTTALLQAVSAVNEHTVWVSGHRATWARTTDAGGTWHTGRMTGPDSALQFRDVHAVSASTAYLLAAGPGDASRIYKTLDSGRTWTLQFRNTDSSAFYDCFDFWDARRGAVVSDAVNGRLIIRLTRDGGATWTPVGFNGIPAALRGEGAFAASGTCLVAGPGGRAWIGTGAVDGAQVYATRDYGETWNVIPTPMVRGQAAGIASLAFVDRNVGLALGGRIGQAQDTSNHALLTTDGGSSWARVGRPPFAGAVYGSAWVPGTHGTVVVTGPGGLAITRDRGGSWTELAANAYWAVGFGTGSRGWAVGPGGRITRLDVR